MRRRHKVLEVSGRDIDDAIAKGLAQLGLSRDEVFIEILNQGRRRLFGLSTEPAQVRILYPVSEEGEQEEMAHPATVEEPISPPLEKAEEIAQVSPPLPEAEIEAEEAPWTEEAEPAAEIEEELPLPATEGEARIAAETVKELLQRMGVEAQVTANEQDDQILVLDINSEDVGILIGPQGETLNALQYIARLIVSRELLHWVTFFLDVDGYRQRRAKELEDLARRMAERVALNKQPLALESMPAHERRIIHITLQDHPLVMTQSVGQGEHRRVTIMPRQ
jgi:spoIIIJ-associated protein